jgi:Mor family transcriptional regulator
MDITRAPYPNRGNNHHRCKITDAQVKEIRRIYEEGNEGYRKLAKRFKCGESTIRDIITFRTRYNTACHI